MESGGDAAYVPISEYALIGDCHGVILIRRDGTIDWASLPRFDSGAYFCRLLDAEKGGCFAVRPRELERIERRYLPDTNVLETTFVTRTGEARLVDCMAMRRGGRDKPLRQLLRLIEGKRGQVTFDVLIEPRFDYASLHPWLQYHAEEKVYTAIGGDDAFVLSTNVDLALDTAHVAWHAEVTVRPKQRKRFALTAAQPHRLELARVSAKTFDARQRATIAWWQDWVKKGNHQRNPLPARDAVVRSALTLKLLTCAPTGAIVAAPTTSLPEHVGGERNWDYRYSWIRDSTMTLQALLSVGHHEVATGFKRFIEVATAGRPDELQIMYGCYGERRLNESQLPLAGYRRSRPVRVGNGAYSQTQLDVYGELMDVQHLWRRAGNPLSHEGWRFVGGLVEEAIRRWRSPDRGMWEIRGEPQHFVYSKVMCWLALERGIQVAEETGLPCVDVARWRQVRDEIRHSVETHGVDKERGCFVQAYGTRRMDASLLRLPIIGFIDPLDERMRKTVDAIREELSVDGLLLRYRPSQKIDGDLGGEGAFLMCSFWLVDVLTMQGRIDEAEQLFHRLVALSNDVGLYSEEYDPVQRQMLGNFPQAFTHVALISAAQQIQHYHQRGSSTRPMADRDRDHHPRGHTWHHRSGEMQQRTVEQASAPADEQPSM